MSAWTVGQYVEYQNGFGTTVVLVDGPFAILEQHPGQGVPLGFILAHGDPDEFCFPYERDPIVPGLDDAKAQLAREKARA